MLEKQAIKKDQFLSTLSLVAKKDTDTVQWSVLKSWNRLWTLPTWTLQNGRSTSFERNSPKEQLSVQDRFERHLFCSSSSFKLTEMYQVQMKRESLLVSIPLLSLSVAPKVFTKLMKIQLLVARKFNVSLIRFLRLGTGTLWYFSSNLGDFGQ